MRSPVRLLAAAVVVAATIVPAATTPAQSAPVLAPVQDFLAGS